MVVFPFFRSRPRTTKRGPRDELVTILQHDDNRSYAGKQYKEGDRRSVRRCLSSLLPPTAAIDTLSEAIRGPAPRTAKKTHSCIHVSFSFSARRNFDGYTRVDCLTKLCPAPPPPPPPPPPLTLGLVTQPPLAPRAWPSDRVDERLARRP